MAIDESTLPETLSEATETRPKDTTWGLFGDEYQLGTLNFLTPERVQAAVLLVRTGRRFNLNLPLNRPPREESTGLRGRYQHRYVSGTEGVGAGQLDEIVDNLNTQTSTQWDGLGHVRHPRFGFYNGIDEKDVKPGDDSKLSVGAWAQAGGIVGRGVLADVPRYFEANCGGVEYDHRERFVIEVELLEAILEWEKVELRPGDILLVRTGAQTDEANGVRNPGVPGLGPGREMGAFLWKHRVAAVASDTSPFEPSPIDPTGPRSMHMQLVPMMGMPIGELFALDELAEDCRRDGVYEFMFVSVPLNLPGGIASPPNAIAIK